MFCGAGEVLVVEDGCAAELHRNVVEACGAWSPLGGGVVVSLLLGSSATRSPAPGVVTVAVAPLGHRDVNVELSRELDTRAS